jgi:hypothetical protein
MNVTEGLHVIVEDRDGRPFPSLTPLVTAGPFVLGEVVIILGRAVGGGKIVLEIVTKV